MPTLTVKDVDTRIDGVYPCEFEFTGRELHTIKQICGIAGGGFLAAFIEGDAGLHIAVAAVILQRNDKFFDIDALWDAPFGNVLVALDPQGDDENPPEQPPKGGSETANDAATGSEQPSSGKSSKASSVSRGTGRKRSGGPGSETNATSRQELSAI